MTATTNDRVIEQDIVPESGSDDVLTALPVTTDEIDELIYGEDRPVAERLQRLEELAGILRAQQAGEIAGNDAAILLGMIREAIGRLSGESAAADEAEPMVPGMSDDPLDHREILSPDSDELMEIEDEDLESLDEADGADVLDPEEWDDIPPARL